jgi:hypothetical protein
MAKNKKKDKGPKSPSKLEILEAFAQVRQMLGVHQMQIERLNAAVQYLAEPHPGVSKADQRLEVENIMTAENHG